MGGGFTILSMGKAEEKRGDVDAPVAKTRPSNHFYSEEIAAEFIKQQ